MNNRDKWLRAKRVVAVISAILLWIVSMNFSYEGFAFNATTMLWFGVVLALIVTVVELTFNTRISTLNPTLIGAGILCYGYGIYTNITGFYSLQGGVSETLWINMNWLFPGFVGLISEILPEALFAWGIGVHDGGDLVGNMIGLFTGEDSLPKRSHENPQVQGKKKITYGPRPQFRAENDVMNSFFEQHELPKRKPVNLNETQPKFHGVGKR